jgi:small subunit ribosomal protein S6
MVVVNSTIGEDAIQALIEKIKTLISENGTIESVESWGRRRLAYPINDLKEGFYVLISFEAASAFPSELERIYRITENILRSIVVRKEIKKTKRQKEAPVQVEEPAQEAVAVDADDASNGQAD